VIKQRTHLGLRMSRPKVATLSSNFKDKFRMTVLMIVSNFVKILQLLTILH